MATTGALPIAAAESLGQQCVVSRLVRAGGRRSRTGSAQQHVLSFNSTAGAAAAAILIQTRPVVGATLVCLHC